MKLWQKTSLICIAVLLVIVRSDAVRTALTGIITSALSVPS